MSDLGNKTSNLDIFIKSGPKAVLDPDKPRVVINNTAELTPGIRNIRLMAVDVQKLPLNDFLRGGALANALAINRVSFLFLRYVFYELFQTVEIRLEFL